MRRLMNKAISVAILVTSFGYITGAFGYSMAMYCTDHNGDYDSKTWVDTFVIKDTVVDKSKKPILDAYGNEIYLMDIPIPTQYKDLVSFEPTAKNQGYIFVSGSNLTFSNLFINEPDNFDVNDDKNFCAYLLNFCPKDKRAVSTSTGSGGMWVNISTKSGWCPNYYMTTGTLPGFSYDPNFNKWNQHPKY